MVSAPEDAGTSFNLWVTELQCTYRKVTCNPLVMMRLSKTFFVTFLLHGVMAKVVCDRSACVPPRVNHCKISSVAAVNRPLSCCALRSCLRPGRLRLLTRAAVLCATLLVVGAMPAVGQIFINPLTTGNLGTRCLGDIEGNYNLNFEIGQTSWDESKVGIGTALNGIGYNYAEAFYYENGDGNNRRVRRNLSGYKYVATGNHYFIYQARGGSNTTSKSGPGWNNSTAYPPADLTSTYFNVQALGNPVVSSSAASTTQINLSHARWAGRSVLIVRKAGAAVTWSPVNGTACQNGQNVGDGHTVVRGALAADTFSDTDLTAGTAYHYSIFSENFSYYSSGETTSASTPPNAPAAPTATSVASTSFTANWVNPGGATSYRLDVSTVSNFATLLSGYNDLEVSGPSQAVAGLTGGTTHYVRVRAVNAGGTSANSTALTQLTVPAPPNTPAASSLTASGFVVSWGAVTGAVSYRLDLATDSGFTSKLGGYDNVSSTSPVTVAGLTASTTYYLRVRAVNTAGTSANSRTLTQATDAAAAPTISLSGPTLDGALTAAYPASSTARLGSATICL